MFDLFKRNFTTGRQRASLATLQAHLMRSSNLTMIATTSRPASPKRAAFEVCSDSKIMFLLNAGAQRIASVMQAVPRGLAVVIDQASKEKKFSE